MKSSRRKQVTPCSYTLVVSIESAEKEIARPISGLQWRIVQLMGVLEQPIHNASPMDMRRMHLNIIHSKHSTLKTTLEGPPAIDTTRMHLLMKAALLLH